MNTIIVHNTAEKLIQSLLDSQLDNTIMIDIIINNNLYSVFTKHKPKYCIFSHKYINQEILQFCEDHADDTNIYIYYSDVQFTTQPLPKCKSIGHSDAYDIIIPNNLAHDEAIKKTNISNNKTNNGIVYYAEYKEVPSNIQDLLYPNTNLHLNIFDAPSFYHYQNLGLLSESDRIHILGASQYYLYSDIAQSYINEAILGDCTPISVQNLVDKSYMHSIAPAKPDCISYTNFFTNKVFA